MKKTKSYLQDKKSRGERIAMLTCYDYPTALWEDESGVDIIFVGDSVGTNVLGYESEREVTLADIVHHLKAVQRGVQNAYLLADLPFKTYESCAEALKNAQTLLNYGADGVKLEGFKPEIMHHLSSHGIQVCAHLGLNPQVHTKKSLQSKTADTALQLVQESLALQEQGAFLMVYELIPEEVAKAATQRLRIPTIGIGAGRFTDGQVLIISDLLGINAFNLQHSRKHKRFQEDGIQAIRHYIDEVVRGEFPGPENVRHLSVRELELFVDKMGSSEPVSQLTPRAQCPQSS